MLKVGTRKQVINGEAVKTSGGLMAGDLRVNKYGKIVSVKVSDNAINRLNNMKGGGEIYLEKIYKSQFKFYNITLSLLYKKNNINNSINNNNNNNKNLNTANKLFEKLIVGNIIIIHYDHYIILFKTGNYIIVTKFYPINFNIKNILDDLWKKQIKHNNKTNLEKLNNRQLKSKLIIYKPKRCSEYRLGQIIDINNKFFGKTTYKIKLLDTNGEDEVLLYKHGSNNKSRIPFFIVRDFVKTGNITLKNTSTNNFGRVYN